MGIDIMRLCHNGGRCSQRERTHNWCRSLADYVVNKLTHNRRPHYTQRSDCRSKNLNGRECRDKINLLLSVGMLRRLCRTRKDVRVGKCLAVDGMLVHKHRYTEDVLDEEQ